MSPYADPATVTADEAVPDRDHGAYLNMKRVRSTDVRSIDENPLDPGSEVDDGSS
jgi:hypothetical protein